MSKIINTFLMAHATLVIAMTGYLKFSMPLILVILGALPSILVWGIFFWALVSYKVERHRATAHNKEGE